MYQFRDSFSVVSLRVSSIYRKRTCFATQLQLETLQHHHDQAFRICQAFNYTHAPHALHAPHENWANTWSLHAYKPILIIPCTFPSCASASRRFMPNVRPTTDSADTETVCFKLKTVHSSLPHVPVHPMPPCIHASIGPGARAPLYVCIQAHPYYPMHRSIMCQGVKAFHATRAPHKHVHPCAGTYRRRIALHEAGHFLVSRVMSV